MKKLNDIWRMYGLVNYQLSGIQKGIQFGHAVVEYSLGYQDDLSYQEWAKECKTFIILNGGTTSTVTDENGNFHGTLNNHQNHLFDIGIKHAHFYEPDLGNQLTAVVFLVHETVYNKTKYPDFWDWDKAIKFANKENLMSELVAIKFGDIDNVSDDMRGLYDHWITDVIGKENFKLREFLHEFKLA